MLEWEKIVASTLAGLVAGLAADPIKTVLMEWRMSRRIRQALHLETICIERTLGINNVVRNGGRRVVTFYSLETDDFEAFDFYFNLHRELFYGDRRLEAIRVFYEEVRQLKGIGETKEDIIEGKESAVALRFRGILDVAIRRGAFDQNLLDRLRVEADKEEELDERAEVDALCQFEGSFEDAKKMFGIVDVDRNFIESMGLSIQDDQPPENEPSSDEIVSEENGN